MANVQSNSRAASATAPARLLKPVTPNDAANLPDGPSRSLYVGGAGAVAVQDIEGNVVTLMSAAGQYHPVSIARVLATGTTATGLIALY